MDEQEVQAHVDHVAKHGYSIARGVLEPDLIDEILAELARFEREGYAALPTTDFTGHRTVRYFGLLDQGEVWQRVATHSALLPVLRGVLGGDCLLSTMGTALVGAGEPAQPIHCDDQLYAMPRPHPPLVCNTMWALDDFTAENGATRIVPGSQGFPDYPAIGEPYETIPLEMPKGSVGFLVGTTYHGAGANESPGTRLGLTINYCSGAMRQQENLMLSTRRELARTFSLELRALIGYRATRFGVGHVNGSDPAELLAAD